MPLATTGAAHTLDSQFTARHVLLDVVLMRRSLLHKPVSALHEVNVRPRA